MTMGFGIYKQSLLLLTNASEDFITKSNARELFLHYKTYKVRQNKRETVGNLCTTDTSKQRPLYERSIVFVHKCLTKSDWTNSKRNLVPKIFVRSSKDLGA